VFKTRGVSKIQHHGSYTSDGWTFQGDLQGRAFFSNPRDSTDRCHRSATMGVCIVQRSWMALEAILQSTEGEWKSSFPIAKQTMAFTTERSGQALPLAKQAMPSDTRLGTATQSCCGKLQ